MQNDHNQAIAIALNSENTKSEDKIAIIMTGCFLVSYIETSDYSHSYIPIGPSQ
jgi:hypothetical protein